MPFLFLEEKKNSVTISFHPPLDMVVMRVEEGLAHLIGTATLDWY